MLLRDFWDRIELRLKITGSNIDRASKEAGHPDALRNQRRKLDKNPNARLSIKTAVLEDIAAALQTTPQWLQAEDGPEERDSVKASTVFVVGSVGSGALVHYLVGKKARVQGPPNSTHMTAGLQVEADASGLTKNAIVFFDDTRRRPGSTVLGKLCVVGLTDGRTFVKRIEKGKGRNNFHLMGDEAIFDVGVTWASPIKWVKMP